MFTTKFGIEIEITGITRSKAAEVTAKQLNATIERTFDSYDTYKITTQDGRIWKLMSDASINCQRKENGRKVTATKEYSVELVSPILSYKEDIEILQELVRQLRRAGSFATENCGIHIHLDGGKSHSSQYPKLHKYCCKQKRPFLQGITNCTTENGTSTSTRRSTRNITDPFEGHIIMPAWLHSTKYIGCAKLANTAKQGTGRTQRHGA